MTNCLFSPPFFFTFFFVFFSRRMSFYGGNNNSPLTVPRTTRSVSNHASFYASLSINERFERLGSGQEMDLFGTSVSRTSVKSQMSKSFISFNMYHTDTCVRICKKGLCDYIVAVTICSYHDVSLYPLLTIMERAKVGTHNST